MEHSATRHGKVIETRQVAKRFGSRVVLTELSLQVGAGEIYGLIGPSGSGKTTAVHILCGHLRPTSGEALVLGEAPSAFSTATRRRIGYMSQQFILYPDLTVRQNIAFVAGLYGLGGWRHRRRIREMLELVELWSARRRPVRATSGGMQRRLALAAALVHDPLLLFADEPTANLDPILRARLWRHFRSRGEAGKTLLVTTQYIDEAEYCDRVGLMFDGSLVAEGRPEALRRQAFGGDMLDITLARPAPAALVGVESLAEIKKIEARGNGVTRVTVDSAEHAIPILLEHLASAGAEVRAITAVRPTFDEVFIELIELHRGQRPATGRIQTSATAEG
jgi:ABC-2 type transport system ATP-binding protein